jgi:hypothetical protein
VGQGVTQAAFLHASEGLDDHLAVATLGSLFHCVRRLVRLLVKSPELGCIAGQVG